MKKNEVMNSLSSITFHILRNSLQDKERETIMDLVRPYVLSLIPKAQIVKDLKTSIQNILSGVWQVALGQTQIYLYLEPEIFPKLIQLKVDDKYFIIFQKRKQVSSIKIQQQQSKMNPHKIEKSQ